MLDRRDFVQGLGFIEDPFEHTNADEEARLSDYFVKPPYFSEVFGNPDDPKSFFVFAPRGGGKSAQRIMIETRCREDNVLALTYDNFDFLSAGSLAEIRLEAHVRRIIQIGLLGILVSIHHDPSKKNELKKSQRSLLASKIVEFVGDLALSELHSTLQSLKSLTDKIGDFVDKYRAIVGTGANALTNHYLGADALIPAQNVRLSSTFDAKYELELLVEFARLVGFRSIYVLIDRVDECEWTGGSGNAKDSFALISPMVRSLSLLETPGIGFKFFLWDAIEPLYKQIARSDRVDSRRLEWSTTDLLQLLQKRLLAFSNNKIWRMSQISGKLSPYDLDELCVIFSNDSPRDVIRICAKTISEQQELDSSSQSLTEAAIYRGLDSICESLVDERGYSATYVKNLRRIGSQSSQVDFTTQQIRSSLDVSATSAGGHIKNWKDAGIIVELSEVPNTRSRKGPKVKLYGVVDVRLARVMTSRLSASEFANSKVKKCENPNCAAYILRDWGERDSSNLCHICGFSSGKSRWLPGFERATKVSPQESSGDETPLFSHMPNTNP